MSDSGNDSSFSGGAARQAGFPDRDLQPVFELLARVARAAVETIGPQCEVVVHDLRSPEHSVVAISGELTGRTVGAPVPDPELLPDVVDAKVADELRRVATTPTGRKLVSSTVWLRDESGHVVGALCINVDVSGLRQARDLIERYLGDEEGRPPLSTFASSVTDFTRTAIATALAEDAGRGRLRKSERTRLVHRLHSQGVFALRGSVDAVAAQLGVSRASVYADLKELQTDRERSDAPVATRPSRGAEVPVATAVAGDGTHTRR